VRFPPLENGFSIALVTHETVFPLSSSMTVCASA
jgi:hypothetical protein